jgi:hypothetical protein
MLNTPTERFVPNNGQFHKLIVLFAVLVGTQHRFSVEVETGHKDFVLIKIIQRGGMCVFF